LIGCAGWTLPREFKSEFPKEGSHLARYAARLSGVEINSSFYRPHRPATYERWAETVPADFRFSVKVPKTITHEAQLKGIAAELKTFLQEATCLGPKLGCLLVQLPPKAEFRASTARAFFSRLRDAYDGGVACEPRHATWFEPEADAVLRQAKVARVAADPARVPAAAEPGGGEELVYYRLHGSPRIYYSAYDDRYLDELAKKLSDRARTGSEIWCIFDNTALGFATGNALKLQNKLRTVFGD
jgi:uncharacterized protein YecE (DUF72 family)